jgi:hypothetical protein
MAHECLATSRWTLLRRTDGHTRGSGGLGDPVLPPGGAVAAMALTCANAGQFWRANRRQSNLG